MDGSGDSRWRWGLVVAAVAVGVVLAVALPVAVLLARDAPPNTTARTTDQSPAPTASSPSEAEDSELPEDFPLLAGLPTSWEPDPRNGLFGPTRDPEPMLIRVCGEHVAQPAVADDLGGEYSNVEDYRPRRLFLFSSSELAAEYVTGVLRRHDACPTPPDEMGVITVGRNVGCDLGDECATVVNRWVLAEGHPAHVGLVSLTVVRVDDLVLLSGTSNEGGAGLNPDQAMVDEAHDAQARAEPVVAAMRDLAASES